MGGTRAVHARLETAPGLDVFPTMGDPALLDGLLVNLFTNSIQAVPEPDAVEITLSCTQNQLLYRDNGPGLPAGCPPTAVGGRLDLGTAG